MKKPTKSGAAKAAKSATPAKPAPSPVIKEKLSKAKPARSSATLTLDEDASPSAAPLVKPFASPAASTTVVAQIDVGFGNTLYIRGEGPGLSWEKGVPLDCVADDKWSIFLSETFKPVVFKFLINDQTWCTGDDYVAQPGATLTVTPTFNL